jgi:hypothetical protein
MKMCRKILGFIAALATMSCQGNIKEKEAPSNKTDKGVIVYKDTAKRALQTLDTINVIALKENYQKGILQIYNEDGSIWKAFELNDNFSDNVIMPLAQKAENRVLVFRCIGRKDNFYSVIVNEEKNVVKYIKPHSPYFNYETWQQHIVKAFSVDFDNSKNPLKEKPLNSSRSLYFNKEHFYHPVEIKGEWLKVKDDDDKQGWIRWHNEKGLLINLYYDA